MIDFTEPMPLTKLEQICKTEKLTKADWIYISKYQVLPEPFIEKFKNELHWYCISQSQNLSESFIEEFKDKVNWFWISKSQNLSESFIEHFKDKVDWFWISRSQVLSEAFIEKFPKRVDWTGISKYLVLSGTFIEQFKDKVNWRCISKYQKLSNSFIQRNVDKIDFYALENNWCLKPTEFKKQLIINTGWFECHETYFVGYKKVRRDRYGLGDFRHQYKKGEIMVNFIDHVVSENQGKFPISPLERVISCKVYYKDVIEICVLQEEQVLCNQLTVLS